MFRLLIIISILVLLHPVCQAQSYLKSQYPAVWERSAAYTLEVAESMPEEHYDYKPVPEVMSFRDQLLHIAGTVDRLADRIAGEDIDFGEITEKSSKKAILEHLQRSFFMMSRLVAEVDEATLQEKVEFAGESVSKENLIYLMRDHMAHHRGQAVLYLRMKGIKPPSYRGW